MSRYTIKQMEDILLNCPVTSKRKACITIVPVMHPLVEEANALTDTIGSLCSKVLKPKNNLE